MNIKLEKETTFLELARKYEELKKDLSDVRKNLDEAMLQLGVGIYLQDPETLAVYKLVKPTGTFTYYKEIDYERTVLEGERRGSLSKKEAEEAGYTLLKT
jgi:hypothetical protein